MLGMDDSTSNQYPSKGGANNDESTSAPNLDTEPAEIMIHRADLAEGRERSARGDFNIEAEREDEEEEDSDSSDTSEEVDEHRLLSASFHAQRVAASAAAGLGLGSGVGGGVKWAGTAAAPGRVCSSAAGDTTRVNLSDSWNDDDIDPFSYGPPLTKWDYFKVSLC